MQSEILGSPASDGAGSPASDGAHSFYLTECIYELGLESQLLHTIVNSSFIITNMKNQLTNLCGN